MTKRCAAESEPAWLKQERQAGERAQGGVGEISCFVEKGMRGMFEFVFYKRVLWHLACGEEHVQVWWGA